MAQLQAPFNAQQFDPTQGGSFKQLPVGKHPVVIVASEIKPTADNSGGMIVYQLQVIDGPAKGAEGPYRVNLYNASDKARSIAESQQAALCYVTGVFLIQDTAQLHNIPFVVEVKEQALTLQQVEKKNAGETVTPFTQVVKVYDIQGNEPKGGAAQAPAQHQQQAPQQPPVQQQAPAPAAGGWAPQAPQQPAAGAWGGGGQVQHPAPAAPAAGGWAQGGSVATGKPAWGAK